MLITHFNYIEYIPFKLSINYMGPVIHNNPHQITTTWYHNAQELKWNDVDRVYIDYKVNGRTASERFYETKNRYN